MAAQIVAFSASKRPSVLKRSQHPATVTGGSSAITVRDYMELCLHDVVPSASPVWARRRQSEGPPRRRELTPWTAPFPARASAPARGVAGEADAAVEADAAAEAETEAAATAPAMEETGVRWSKMEEAARSTKPGKWQVRVGRAPFARAEAHSERDWEMTEAAADVDAAAEPAGLEAEVEEALSPGRDHTEMEAEAPPGSQTPTVMRTRWKWYKALAYAAERGRQWSDRWLSPGPKRPPGARRVSQREVWGDRSEVWGDSSPGAQRVSQGAEPLPSPALCSQPQLGAAPPKAPPDPRATPAPPADPPAPCLAARRPPYPTTAAASRGDLLEAHYTTLSRITDLDAELISRSAELASVRAELAATTAPRLTLTLTYPYPNPYPNPYPYPNPNPNPIPNPNPKPYPNPDPNPNPKLRCPGGN